MASLKSNLAAEDVGIILPLLKIIGQNIRRVIKNNTSEFQNKGLTIFISKYLHSWCTLESNVVYIPITQSHATQ